MHYPPETSSIMLMARMVATIKQVPWVVLLSHCGCYSQGFLGLAFSAFILTILPLSGLGRKVVLVQCLCLIVLSG